MAYTTGKCADLKKIIPEWRRIIKTIITCTASISISIICSEMPEASIISVGNTEQLVSAISGAFPGDTILMEDGLYYLSSAYWSVPVPRTKSGLIIRSRSGNRESVIISGRGMNADGHHGFWIAASDVTIRDITIQNVRNHCIQTDINVDGLKVINCILQDAGEQMLKVPFSAGNPDPSENGLVEECIFEYTAGKGPRYYIGGIDVHKGKDWIVRNNIFKYIRSPEAAIAEHAIHFWSSSEGTIVEGNLIITCDRGIGFGLGSVPHFGGIIRNNMIYHDGTPGRNDVGIGLESAAGVRVFNNTVFHESAYPNAIEYRFAGTAAEIANNLTNRSIKSRDGGSAVMFTNYTAASPEYFISSASGDLHLTPDAENAIDMGMAFADVENDYDRQPRPLGSAFDIGADEYLACSSDHDGDGDSDGRDLFAFANDFKTECLESFSSGFGH